jgi:tRNA-2-methylthio-N6-dimethylallyladenosine synthase
MIQPDPEEVALNTEESRSGPSSGKTFFIKTFGCQMNVHDSERMSGLLMDSGGVPVENPEEAEIILVNTCTIRDKADQKALSDLGRLRRIRKKGGILAVTGCMAQREGEELFRMVPDVDLLLGPSQIRNLIPLIERAVSGEKHVDGTILPLPEMTTPPAFRPEGATAFVTVQEGCDKACAYCVVPSTRGPERSRPVKDIIQEIRDLVDLGYREITLLGQNVNGYGKKDVNGNAAFFTLLEKIHEIPGLKRIRFTTSHPVDMSEELVETMKTLPRLMPHLHLPLQSGSDAVLARMQRGYTVDEYRYWAKLLRREIPRISLTTDLIVGFCGETEEEFTETCRAVEEFRFEGAFSFIYSPRPSTPAFHLDNMPSREVSVERLERLQAQIEELSSEINRKMEGSIVEVLVEKWDPGTGVAIGRTPQFRNVKASVSGNAPIPSLGDLILVRIESSSKTGIRGTAIGMVG